MNNYFSSATTHPCLGGWFWFCLRIFDSGQFLLQSFIQLVYNNNTGIGGTFCRPEQLKTTSCLFQFAQIADNVRVNLDTLELSCAKLRASLHLSGFDSILAYHFD